MHSGIRRRVRWLGAEVWEGVGGGGHRLYVGGRRNWTRGNPSPTVPSLARDDRRQPPTHLLVVDLEDGGLE